MEQIRNIAGLTDGALKDRKKDRKKERKTERKKDRPTESGRINREEGEREEGAITYSNAWIT